jgi:hypothetical protein
MALSCAAEAAVPNLPGRLGMEYRWKIRTMLEKSKPAPPTCPSKQSHLYGFSKIHKPGIPLRPIVSSIGSPCYALAGFLHKISSPLVGQSQSVKNSGHFTELLKPIKLHLFDTLVSFDVVSMFTNVPVDEAFQVI